ncbi:MAG: glycosyltransferase [Myxococcales bacterium]|nr:glycosyltransferase [Myxococcales bacterium]
MSQIFSECIFESPTEARDGTPRVLLIAYHFPPGQAAGALRWQKFVTHGAERGWAFDVITLDPASLDSADPSRLDQLPAGTRVFAIGSPRLLIERLGRAIWRVYRSVRPLGQPDDQEASEEDVTQKHNSDSFHRDHVTFQPTVIRSWMRANNAWIEYARTRSWAHRAAALGRRLVAQGAHCVVVSSGPPHMAHEGARRLSQASGLPLVIDLRDPWSLYERLPRRLASPLWYRFAARYERLAVRQAALIVMNTESGRRAMASRYPDQNDRIIIVANGFDDDEAMPTSERDGRFLIAFAGSVYLDRSPKQLFEAAGRVVRELGLSPADFGIELMGHHITGADERPIRAMAKRAGLEPFLRLHPPGTRQQAAEFLARAVMLVSLPQDSHLAIPSKIFEYMRYDAWLLAIAERDSATELLLRETEADVVSPDDVEGLTEVLRIRYAEHRTGRRPLPIARSEPRFGRSAQAELLFDALEQITVEPGGPSVNHTS